MWIWWDLISVPQRDRELQRRAIASAQSDGMEVVVLGATMMAAKVGATIGMHRKSCARPTERSNHDRKMPGSVQGISRRSQSNPSHPRDGGHQVEASLVPRQV